MTPPDARVQQALAGLKARELVVDYGDGPIPLKHYDVSDVEAVVGTLLDQQAQAEKNAATNYEYRLVAEATLATLREQLAICDHDREIAENTVIHEAQRAKRAEKELASLRDTQTPEQKSTD